MRFQAGIQIILLITAVVIVFTVIKPKFETISQSQAEAVAYKTALDNIGQYNARLQDLMNQASAISADDLAALYRYLPEKIDAVEVGRDIANIATDNGLLLLDVSPEDAEAVETEIDAAAAPADPTMSGDAAMIDPTMPGDPNAFVESSARTRELSLSSQTFDVKAIGSYDDMKAMLQDLERNDYPLQVVEFSFVTDEEGGDLMEYTLVLRTYSLAFRE